MSFRDKLLNTNRPVTVDDDIQLSDEDVILGKEGTFPSISFSQRVHRLLEDSMKHAVILKLLGRPIGYGRLRDHLFRLWKFTSPFKLSNIEGGCFIVNFSNEFDY